MGERLRTAGFVLFYNLSTVEVKFCIEEYCLLGYNVV
jgi:hypothetical protein